MAEAKFFMSMIKLLNNLFNCFNLIKMSVLDGLILVYQASLFCQPFQLPPTQSFNDSFYSQPRWFVIVKDEPIFY